MGGRKRRKRKRKEGWEIGGEESGETEGEESGNKELESKEGRLGKMRGPTRRETAPHEGEGG